jgi:hypothetical protein
MTNAEFKMLKKGSHVYWCGDAADQAVSPKQAGMPSRSLGTMVRSPGSTMVICGEIQRAPVRPVKV